MFESSWVHNLSYLSVCCSFASNWHGDMMHSAVSSNCLQSAICYQLLFVRVLLHEFWLAMPHLVLLLFNFVSPFRSPLNSHRNAVYGILIYWPCITSLSLLYYKDSSQSCLCVEWHLFLCYFSCLIGLILLQPVLLCNLSNAYLVDCCLGFK